MTPLPKLPTHEAKGSLRRQELMRQVRGTALEQTRHYRDVMGLTEDDALRYTATDMLAMQRNTLEWAAQRCDEIAADAAKRPTHLYVEGLSDGADECAEAIREALK